MLGVDTISRLAAMEAIRQAVARYARGVDRLDVALMQSAYWPDAIDDHGVYVGDAMAFCERVVATHARYESTMHCNMNHAIEIDDDGRTARGEIYNMTFLLRRDEDGTPIVDHWMGRYLDRYECRDGDWRIAHRVCVHEWTRSSPIDQAMPIAAEKFRQGSADRGNGARLGP
jgi:hypothetical protein